MTEHRDGSDVNLTKAEFPLVPGELLILERQVGGRRLKGAAPYIGRKGYRYLLADLPMANGSPIFSTAGCPCVVRFLVQGVMFGFQSTVEHISFQPIPVIYLAYPDQVERVNLRKEKRVKVNLATDLRSASGEETKTVPGRIVDISHSGCRVLVDQGFEMNDLVDLRIGVEGGQTIEVPASTVRNVTNLGGGHYALGLQFTEETADWRDYVTRVSALIGEEIEGGELG
jgi:c-di-GMP-binding flagellar brake protein YcgR